MIPEASCNQKGEAACPHPCVESIMEPANYYAFLCVCVQVLRGCASEKQVRSMTTRYHLGLYKTNHSAETILGIMGGCVYLYHHTYTTQSASFDCPWTPPGQKSSHSYPEHLVQWLKDRMVHTFWLNWTWPEPFPWGKNYPRGYLQVMGYGFIFRFLFEKNLSWPPVCSHASFPPPFLYYKVEKKLGPGRRNPRLLAWKIPWTEEPGRLQSMGSQESDTT